MWVLKGLPRRDGAVVSVSVSHAVGRGVASRPGHSEDHHKHGKNCLTPWLATIEASPRVKGWHARCRFIPIWYKATASMPILDSGRCH